jgi:glycosyltransferase involved in cell wall biosynthesis
MQLHPHSERGVSIVLAAYNEAPTIEQVVRGCREHTPGVLEVIVVDDGSRDRTADIATACGATVIRMGTNGGKGRALCRGIEAARGDVLLFMDADGQDDPADIPRLFEALARDVDLVVGSRFLGHFGPGAITPLNRFGNQALTHVVNVLFRVKLTDTQAGFKVVRRRVLERIDLGARRYDIEVDLLLRAIRSGGKVVEVPVSRARREHGASGLDSFRDGARILRRIVRVRVLG